MTLTLVISEEKTSLITRYEDSYVGFFVREDAVLCRKPEKKSHKCFEVLSGKEFEYNGEPVYHAHFEGGD